MPHPSLHAPSHGYVFVITYGRSGSTVVQNLLNALPGYCIRGENANALPPLIWSWHLLASSEVPRGMRRDREISHPGHPWYGIEEVSPRDWGLGLADLFVREVLRLPPGTRVGGFKEIRFHNRPPPFEVISDFLRTFFPKARLIYNIRDHDAVLKSGWWAQMDPEVARAELVAAEALFRADLAAHPESSLLLRYEDYRGNPEGLRPLFDFLREPFNPALAERVLGQRLDHMQG